MPSILAARVRSKAGYEGEFKIKKISNNGVLVETSTKEEMQHVLSNKKLTSAGLVTSLPAKKKPLLIVYDVPNTFDDKLLLSSLRQQNFEGDQRENFNDAIRFSHKTGSRSGETTNYVLEVSPQFEKLYSNKTGSTSAATPCTSETTSQ